MKFMADIIRYTNTRIRKDARTYKKDSYVNKTKIMFFLRTGFNIIDVIASGGQTGRFV